MNYPQIMQKCYTISLKDLVDIWVESFHIEDHVVIIWDALVHYDYLLEKGLKLNKAVLFDNKVLIIRVESIEDSMKILNDLPIEDGPFVQIYSEGKFITDNIDK